MIEGVKGAGVEDKGTTASEVKKLCAPKKPGVERSEIPGAN
jgi:hypothetical protein